MYQHPFSCQPRTERERANISQEPGPQCPRSVGSSAVGIGVEETSSSREELGYITPSRDDTVEDPRNVEVYWGRAFVEDNILSSVWGLTRKDDRGISGYRRSKSNKRECK